MVITETCSCATEFNIDNPDKRVCIAAYSSFLRDHYDCSGRAERLTTKRSIIRGAGRTPIIKRTEKEVKGPRV